MEDLNCVNRAGTTSYGAANGFGWLLLAIFLATLAACSSGSNSGTSQGASLPMAIATPLGYEATGTNPVSITVRSGADVQLTGADSFDGNVGIKTFGWTQTDTAPTPSAQLIYRNASTVSFTAPSVASPTTLHFQLTVTTQLGSSTATVQVVVQPASDPNRFLSLLGAPHHFRVALSLTSPAHVPGDTIPLSADAPVCVKLSSSIRYLAYSGSTYLFPLAGQQVDAKWLASVGAVAGFVGPGNPATTYSSAAYLNFRNPVVSFDLPVLNDDLIFAAYNSAADQSLVPSDIDQAYVPMTVSAKRGSCDGTLSGDALGGLQLMMQLEDESGNTVGEAVTGAVGAEVTVDSSSLPQPNPLTPDGSAELTPDDFLRVAQASNRAIETRESAAAYYKAIDPQSAKTTLSAWLNANCFDANSLTYGAGETAYNVVHATYTNNFDLGFGRDMYFATCPNGNLASVVINYPSLDAAANRIGAFLAVAMEYSPPASSPGPCFGTVADPTTNNGDCFAKFYAFAPDNRTGIFRRVQSVDFDRRGQKYLPGVCTVCHGGAPSYKPGAAAPAAVYPSGLRGLGDLDAAFMPWDLGSLLFSDTDPAFSCTVSSTSATCLSINPALYTQAAQATNIQKLNALAWRTYDIYSMNGKTADVIQPGNVPRFQGGVDLLNKWYGTDPGAASAHAFDDSATPMSWPADGQSAPNDVYHQVFAHYCRACHTQSKAPNQQFSSGLLGALAPLAKTATLSTIPQNVQQLAFARAQMPLSRLTTDRFWVNFSGGQSAAQTLALYINGLAITEGPSKVASVDMSGGNVIPPGAQILMPLESTNLFGSTTNALSTAAANPLNRFQGASLDALTQSLFISSYQWTLCGSATSTCTSNTFGLVGTPIVPADASAGATQTGASLPALPTNAVGTFYLTLTASSAITGQAPLTQVYPLAVSASDPKLVGCTTNPAANFNGQQILIDVSSCFAQVSGQPQLGDPPYTLQISYDGITYGPNAGGTSLAWQANVVPASGAINPMTGFPQVVPTIQFNFTPNATSNAPLYFKWCDGNSDASSCALGSTQVTLLTGLSATPASFLGYWNPAANSNYDGRVFTPPVTGLPMQPSLSLSALNSAISFDAPTGMLTLAAPSDGGSLSSYTLTGSASGLSTQVSMLTYGPCGNFVTQDINGNDTASSILLAQLEPPCAIPLAGGVTFAYTLSGGGQSANSSGTVNIRALSSFQQTASSVYATLGASCASSSCHGGGVIFWQYNATSANSTYASISTGHDNFRAPLVEPGKPAQSVFYTAPCLGTDTSGAALQGMPQIFQPTASECQILYQWILEGGQND